jgi:hypothetical protein
MDTDYVAELQQPLKVQGDLLEEETMRYFALLILYTVTIKAKQLAVKCEPGGVKVTVDTGEEKQALPPPPEVIATTIIAMVRAMTHIEDDHGETVFSLGLRNTPVELRVKVKRSGDTESVKLKFPEL